jgi:membrane-bound metal-dependent hydrolase YbcI (DUF457 family)
MMWFTHAAFGMLCASTIRFFFSIQNPVLFALTAAFFSLMPDIDHPEARIHRYLPYMRWFGKVFKHRGFFHAVFPLILIYAVFYSIGLLKIGYAAIIGYTSHLIADSLTVKGIAPLNPIVSWRLRGPIEVNSISEYAFFVVNILFILLLIVGF